MNKQYIALLKKQIAKLDDPHFDLEAWKSGVTATLRRVFPEDQSYLGQIELLKVENSSWTLRDSGANYNPLETAKKKGRAILEAVTDELEILSKDPQSILSQFVDAETAKLILTSKTSEKEKLKALGKLKKEELAQIILLSIH